MTEPTNLVAVRAARKLATDNGQFVPTDADNRAIAADNRDHDQQTAEAGQRAKPLSTWQEIADWVDEPTWLRILSDLTPETRAECEQIRPPAGLTDTTEERQAEALGRLRRAHTPRRPQ